MDMWEPYKDIAVSFFPNAKIVVDKYHYVRQMYWALDKTRKRVQKEFIKTKRIYFKNSRKLLFKENALLSEEKQEYVRRMLDQNDDLRTAWELKELFVRFRKCTNSITGRKELSEWILTAQEANLPEFKTALQHLLTGFNTY